MDGEHAPWAGVALSMNLGACAMDWGSILHRLGEHFSQTGGVKDLSKISRTKSLSPLPIQPQIDHLGHISHLLHQPSHPRGGHACSQPLRPSQVHQLPAQDNCSLIREIDNDVSGAKSAQKIIFH